MSRRSVPTFLVVLLPVLALGGAPAHAADPLLSGYAGPGGGEQAVLGATLIPAKHGNGSLRAPSSGSGAPVARPTGSSAVATPPASSAPAAGTPAAPPSAGAPASSGSGRTTGTTGTGTRTGTSNGKPSGTTGAAPTAPGGAGSAPDAAPVPDPAVVVGPAETPRPVAATTSSAGSLPLTRGQVLGVLAAVLLLAACAAGTIALTSRPATGRRI